MSIKPEQCVWEEEVDFGDGGMGAFETSCDNSFAFNDGGISENDFKFCPYCGGAIMVTVDAGDLV